MHRLLWIAPVLVGVLAAAAILLLRDEPATTYTAEEFIAEANSAGAGIMLEESVELFAETSGAVHAIAFADEAGGDADRKPGEHEHGSATLVVTESDEEAIAAYERCESALSFVCFRAANVVLQLEGADAEEVAQLREAFLALGEAE